MKVCPGLTAVLSGTVTSETYNSLLHEAVAATTGVLTAWVLSGRVGSRAKVEVAVGGGGGVIVGAANAVWVWTAWKVPTAAV